MMESLLSESAVRMTAAPDLLECRPELLSPDQSELASGAFRKFLTGLAARLPGYLGVAVEIGYAGSRQGPPSALIPEEPEAYAVLLELSPAPGQAILLVSRSLASAALESLLGAPEDLESECHEFLTDLDLKLLDGFVSVVSGELERAWQPMTEASFRALNAVAVGRSGKLNVAEQSVVVLSAEVVIRGASGSLHLVIPSLFVRLASEATAADAESGSGPARDESNMLLKALGSVSVRVDAVLHGSEIRIRDLLALKEGTLLMLPRQVGTPLEGQVNGVVKMRGSLISDGRFAGFELIESPGGAPG